MSSFLQPKNDEIELMHYLREASSIDKDNLYLRSLEEESNKLKALHVATENYARALAMRLAFQHIREYGALNMGKVKR